MSLAIAPATASVGSSSSMPPSTTRKNVVMGTSVVQDYGAPVAEFFKKMSDILESMNLSLKYHDKIFTIVGSSKENQEEIKEALLKISCNLWAAKMTGKEKNHFQFKLEVISA